MFCFYTYPCSKTLSHPLLYCFVDTTAGDKVHRHRSESDIWPVLLLYRTSSVQCTYNNYSLSAMVSHSSIATGRSSTWSWYQDQGYTPICLIVPDHCIVCLFYPYTTTLLHCFIENMVEVYLNKDGMTGIVGCIKNIGRHLCDNFFIPRFQLILSQLLYFSCIVFYCLKRDTCSQCAPLCSSGLSVYLSFALPLR